MLSRRRSRAHLRRLAMALAIVVALAAVALAPLEVGTTRIVTTVEIGRAPAEVFDFVTTPAHWPQWHPSSLAVSGDAAHPLRLGESVVEDFRVAGRRGRATWRVSAIEPARRWRIDAQIDGRFAGSVTYTLSARGERTHFVREFEYPSPNILFAIVNVLSLRSQIDAESAQALRQLKAVLESRPGA